MDFDNGSTRIYHCQICDVDTPHQIKGNKGDVYGIVCSNCSCGALVSRIELQLYQLKWEEELRAILDSLVDQPLGYDEE